MIKTETKNLHTKVDIVSRRKGHKVIAKAAYNARAKIEDERYGKTEDYTNIKDLVFSKVYLPGHVPKEFSDRSFLWNDVERFEKSSNSQLARNLIFALPRELNEEQRIELLEQFVKENFTDKGMIADVNVHNPDASDGLEQPHAHILLTLREIDEKGKWKPKSRKEYILDEEGERIKLPSGNWKSRKVNVNDWNKRTKAKEWRENFSKLANEYLEKKYINHRNMNSKVVLFVREHKNNKKLNIADSYTFLGKAEFVSYKGSKPMNIIWKLEEAIPSNFINKTNKLVAR